MDYTGGVHATGKGKGAMSLTEGGGSIGGRQYHRASELAWYHCERFHVDLPLLSRCGCQQVILVL
jgi:hypothetical protein